MKVSRAWLQKFFDTPLPDVNACAEALTFHAFEIESVEGDVLDVKVLPDRAGYALSHRGIASELSAILNIPVSHDPLRTPLLQGDSLRELSLEADPAYVLRHVGAIVRGVTVGPSPAWLKEALESVGQRSINNIVDASNFVMLHIGQPTHAFDADKIGWDGDTLRIAIREAKDGEKLHILTGEELTLGKGMYVIADATRGNALDVAGIKGGRDTGITENTKTLFISSGNYDGTLLRKTAQKLSLFTDASQRFQNRPSPELTAYGMRDLLALIREVAGGEVLGVLDIKNHEAVARSVTVHAQNVADILGAPFSAEDVAGALARLRLPFTQKGDAFVVTPPFERTDIVIAEDVVEEVGRVIGYDRVPPRTLEVKEPIPFSDHRKRIEAVRALLQELGFNEVSTYSFTETGDIEMAKPLADDKKFLRTSMAESHKHALALNLYNAPLFNAPDVRLFEIGHVWPKGEEKFVLGVSYLASGKGGEKKRDAVFTEVTSALKNLLGQVPEGKVIENTLQFDMHELVSVDVVPQLQAPSSKLLAFHTFSIYPFVLRDIAVWVPEKIHPEDVSSTIRANAGESLVRVDLFDSFSKDGKNSYAFHLVFQSHERTLSDEEVGKWMGNITEALANKGWTVR